jgi:hypothetical protein
MGSTSGNSPFRRSKKWEAVQAVGGAVSPCAAVCRNGIDGKIKCVSTHASTPLAAPIGVIESFGRGFETVLSQLSLIALPLLLDLFLWLGPHLTVAPLLGEVSVMLEAQLRDADVPGEMYDAMHLALQQAGESLNVFGFLSTAPLGVPSMMVANASAVTPLGAVLSVPVSSGVTLFGLTVGLSVMGLLLGAAFFGLVARRVLPEEQRGSDEQMLGHLWGHWLRLLGFAATVLLAMLLFGFVMAMLSALLSMLHALLGGVATSLGIALWIWALFFVTFTVHGVVMHNRELLPALRNSLRMVRWNMPAVTVLFALIIVLSWGLGFLWSLPPGDSWLLLAGITAHAFVATGVVAATFHFYQDRLRWCDDMQAALAEQKRRAQTTVRKETPKGN